MAFKKSYFFKAIDKSGKEYKRLIANPGKKRAFLLRIRTLKAKKSSKYYLKVSYGLYEDCWGKKTAFFNDGEYKTKKDLLFAFKAFDELTEEDF